MKSVASVILLLVLVAVYFVARPKSQIDPARVRTAPIRDSNEQGVAASVQATATAISNKSIGSSLKESPPAKRSVRVDQEIQALAEAASKQDADSFQIIVAGLSHANPEIRRAALEAAMQSGNRDAIPILRELASKSPDAREKIALEEAAEFLELPSLSEIRAQKRGKTNSTVSAPK